MILRRLGTSFVLILSFGLSGCGAGASKGAESPANSSKDEASSEEAADPDDSSLKESGAASKKEKKEKDEKKTSEETAKESAEKPVAEAPPKKKEEAPKKAPRPEMSKKARRAFDAGAKAFVAGDLAGAQTQYSAAVSADKNAYEAHLALGVVYERQGQYGKAASAYDAAVRVVPDYEEAIVASALLQARQGKPDAALSYLNKHQAQTGKTAAILAAMAEVKSIQGQSGDAQKLAQQALKENPNFKPAMVALARDHYRARRIDLALYALTGILDGYGEGNPPRDKNNAEALYLRGLIYSERGMRGPAMEELEKAVKVRPDLVDAHLLLANYMMEAGNAKDAKQHLVTAIRYDSKNVAAHLQLGDAYRLLGKPDNARKELEWVLAAEPNQAAAHYNLGLLYLLGGTMKGVSESASVDKALEHLEAYKARAVRGGPDDVDDLITRAKTQKAVLKAKQEEKATKGGK